MRKAKQASAAISRYYESDMAKERCLAHASGQGIFHAEEEGPHYTLTEVRITTKGAAERIGRPEGRYATLTFSAANLLGGEALTALEERLMTLLLDTVPRSATRILIVGLGNRRLTVDSIGPKTAEAVTATAALRGTPSEGLLNGIRQLSVFCPDVFGETGMEAAGLVKSAVSLTRAEAVIAIDAMASSHPKHLLRAIELADTGTVPGAGVGNRRAPLSRDTVGVPVTAIGIPTMMRARPYIRRALTDFGVEAGRAETYAQKEEGLLVVPHGLDEGTVTLSHLVSRSINAAFGFGAEA